MTISVKDILSIGIPIATGACIMALLNSVDSKLCMNRLQSAAHFSYREAKVLYGILLKRMDLSAKNGWFDDQGRVFIICTLEEIMETMNCADNKATKLMNELEEKCGLIERKRQGQGKPNLIYVKNFISSVDNSGVQPLQDS